MISLYRTYNAVNYLSKQKLRFELHMVVAMSTNLLGYTRNAMQSG